MHEEKTPGIGMVIDIVFQYDAGGTSGYVGGFLWGLPATDYLKAHSISAYTRQAMDHWADFIRQRMDMAHSVVSEAE